MATGINVDKMNAIKVALLDDLEVIKGLANRLESCKLSIQTSLVGAGSKEAMSKLDAIISGSSNIAYNVNSYIQTLSDVTSAYINQDSSLSFSIVQDIAKIDGSEEE